MLFLRIFLFKAVERIIKNIKIFKKYSEIGFKGQVIMIISNLFKGEILYEQKKIHS